ncbi:hypothetical protein K435DRAFT_855517 [Dendrothele bispora CBS 962.96]|uniref:Uncharacterized protein n=1 Tax=Dendrothele bispora (strain CBS 962.96) TaxID=1314807 RepID=A0A4S8MB60_DENBC|nr:hypothetical protein K435DRAFT_855517 [Dendrothele bispora CBS 962.96]
MRVTPQTVSSLSPRKSSHTTWEEESRTHSQGAYHCTASGLTGLKFHFRTCARGLYSTWTTSGKGGAGCSTGCCLSPWCSHVLIASPKGRRHPTQTRSPCLYTGYHTHHPHPRPHRRLILPGPHLFRSPPTRGSAVLTGHPHLERTNGLTSSRSASTSAASRLTSSTVIRSSNPPCRPHRLVPIFLRSELSLRKDDIPVEDCSLLM